MPWSDLSDVTGALIRLEVNIEQVLSPGNDFEVVPTPPDRLGANVSNTLSLYLYHLRPSAQARNLPNPASHAQSSATAPMSLDLFYVLTAHQRRQKTFDALTEQRLMGYALRTFHDYPVLTDAIQIAGQSVLSGSQRGRNNPLKIEMGALEPEGSLALRSTSEWPFPRLAAYYRVGPVLLGR